MFPMTLIVEIASMRLRQKRILQILRDAKITQWDGVIQKDDAELETIIKEITEKWAAEQREFTKLIVWQSESRT